MDGGEQQEGHLSFLDNGDRRRRISQKIDVLFSLFCVAANLKFCMVILLHYRNLQLI